MRRSFLVDKLSLPKIIMVTIEAEGSTCDYNLAERKFLDVLE